MKTLPDEKVVYLALKNVFKGSGATVRRLKLVRKFIIEALPIAAPLSNLTDIYGVEAVSQVAQILLRDGIFESTAKARIRFPDAVDDSPPRCIDCEIFSTASIDVSGAGSTTPVAMRGASENLQDSFSQADDSEMESFDTYYDSNPSNSRSRSKSRHRAIRPQPFICLDRAIQHRILTHVQQLLEYACFNFARRTMPEVLEKHHWDCPEAAELNQWVPELRKRQTELFGVLGDIQRPYDKLICSLAELRHTAVHRISVSAQRLKRFLLDAEKLSALMGDAPCRVILAKLRLITQEVTAKLESHKRVLACKRAELDRIREMGIAELERDESEYRASTVKSLEEILPPSMALPSVVTADKDEMNLKTDENTCSLSDSRQDSESQAIEVERLALNSVSGVGCQNVLDGP